MSDVRVEPNAKWVRGTVAGEVVVDTRRSTFVWELPYYPAWYFDRADIRAELRPNGDVESTRTRGDAVVRSINGLKKTPRSSSTPARPMHGSMCCRRLVT